MKIINLVIVVALVQVSCVVDPPVDATSAEVVGGASSIHGRRFDRHRLTSGATVLQPFDLSTTPIEAQVETAAGFDIHFGVGAADGTFTIAAVPRGRSYWLRVGTNWYLTRERTVDVGVEVLGRPDAELATAGTRLVLDVDGLAPVTAGDDFQIEAPDARIGFYSTAGLANPIIANAPAVGDTALAGAVFPFDQDAAAGTTAFPLIQASRGDTFTFAQLTTRQTGGVSYLSLSRALTVPLEMAQGAATTVRGTLVAPPRKTTIVDYRQVALEAVADDIAPNATATASNLFIDANPVGLILNLGTPDLVEASFAPGGANQVIPFEYRNPYPAFWPVHGISSTTFSVPYVGPAEGGGTVERATSVTNLGWELVRHGRLRVDLVVTPPLDVEIDGEARSSDVQITGATPLVTWDAPSEGRPARYIVRVIRLNATAPFTAAVARLVVSASTQRIRIPAGLLEPGEHYQIHVRAFATADHHHPSLLEPAFIPPAATANSVSTTIRVE